MINQVFKTYESSVYGTYKHYKYCPMCGGPLEFKEWDGRMRQVCNKCSYVYYKNPSPGVVVLIEKDGMVLLGKRLGRHGRGKWCLPGGFIEYEEDFLAAASREIMEETGLKIVIKSILNVVTNYLTPELHALVIVLLAGVSEGTPKAGDDIEELKWYPLSGPLPDMAFESDIYIIERYYKTGHMGVIMVESEE